MSAETADRLRQIRYERGAALASVIYIIANWPDLHGVRDFRKLKLNVVQDAFDNAERTYFVRLFAEFETVLRQTQRPSRFRGRRLPTKTRDLISRVASDHRLPDELRENADQVRRQRNYYVHDSSESFPERTLGQAVSDLTRYVARLP